MEILKERIAVLIPSDIEGKDISGTPEHDTVKRQVLKALCAWFGGATSQAAEGAWLGADGEIVFEDITRVYSNTTPETLKDRYADLFELAADLKITLKQEAIAVEIGQALHLV